MEDVAEVREETDDNTKKHSSTSSFVVVRIRQVLISTAMPL